MIFVDNMVIGFTCGAWDLLHAGHIRLLKESKEKCDYLIVGIHENPHIERDWKNCPVESVEERIEKIDAIKYVDEYMVYKTEDDLYRYLSNSNINIRFLGDDYINKSFTGDDLDIEVCFHKRDKNLSSSHIRNRIKSLNP